MKSPFDKAIKSFRKQIKRLSKEEIEERLNKYKIMDLTDKIISIHLYDEPIEFICGVDTCLKEITPKVAIDFANWLRENYSTHEKWEPIELDNNMYRPKGSSEEYTPEELFQEFFKDYKYDS